jgi:hypothetical protein
MNKSKMGLFNKKKPQPEAAPPPVVKEELPVVKEEAPVDSSVNDTVSDKTPRDDNEDVSIGDDDSLQATRATEWDEGGPSHCGYHETVHDTLMAVGKSVHSVVGSPPEPVDTKMNVVANWFQEASYAVRDFLRGKSNMSEDVNEIMNTIMSQSHSKDEGEEKAEDVTKPADPPAGTGTA